VRAVISIETDRQFHDKKICFQGQKRVYHGDTWCCYSFGHVGFGLEFGIDGKHMIFSPFDRQHCFLQLSPIQRLFPYESNILKYQNK
jgi:hypothetical protein